MTVLSEVVAKKALNRYFDVDVDVARLSWNSLLSHMRIREWEEKHECTILLSLLEPILSVRK